MGGIAGAGAITGKMQMEAEYQARLLAKQLDVLKEQGGNAVKLIQSATAKVPGQAQHLDIRI